MWNFSYTFDFLFLLHILGFEGGQDTFLFIRSLFPIQLKIT